MEKFLNIMLDNDISTFSPIIHYTTTHKCVEMCGNLCSMYWMRCMHCMYVTIQVLYTFHGRKRHIFWPPTWTIVTRVDVSALLTYKKVMACSYIVSYFNIRAWKNYL